MSNPVVTSPNLLAKSHDVVTRDERQMLREFDAQRRLNLLRVILPGLFAVAAAAIPFAILSDAGTGTFQSTEQVGIGLVGFAIGAIAVWRRRVNLASFALFAGVLGVIIDLILSLGPMQGHLDLISIPPFALLALPIIIAGVFGGPLPVVATMFGTSAFSVAVIALTPHGPDLARALQRVDGYSVFTITVAVQMAVGIMMIAATRGFQRTLRELGDVRVAYAREKELERLKDHFIASVNHELRTPIMALQGYLEVARELGARGDAARQTTMLKRGTEAADQLAALVKSVLNVRQIERDAGAIQPKPFALEPVIRGAAQLIDPRDGGEQERSLRLHLAPDARVYADEDRVRQVVLNLLSNAVKYSPAGSAIEVTAQAEAPRVVARGWRRAAIRPPRMMEVSVRDRGLGIPPEQAALVFQRFVRLERDIASTVVGTGLGLALCKSYVEAMGGQIWVTSSGVAGDGTTITFTLPLRDPASATSAA
ncbi:MAG TPA: HAMP domain-containing sensor histidine kinase [Ktedonobacterales bacterium]|nr:HAMP domain-containing sensor histidine kinase [Ktedonobacterales bacterium]